MKTKLLAFSDDGGLNQVMKSVLPMRGFDIEVFTTIEEGMGYLKNETPEAIMIHIESGKGKGLALSKALRKIPKLKTTPILLMSDGPDEFIKKPFGLEEMFTKLRKMLWQSKSLHIGEVIDSRLMDFAVDTEDDFVSAVQKSGSGIIEFDKATRGGLPKGSNVLLIGKIGSGKSHFCRSFLSEGLKNYEPCLYATLDDNPLLIRRELSKYLGVPLEDFTKSQNLFCMVDAYNWGGGEYSDNEKYALKGSLNLTKLSGLIQDASEELGQDSETRAGGRRVIDSLTSLMVNFDLSHLQHFLFRITRTAISFGYATTLFTLEEGTIEEGLLNNLTYIMDGVLEMEAKEDGNYVRVKHMKWVNYDKDWIPLRHS